MLDVVLPTLREREWPGRQARLVGVPRYLAAAACTTSEKDLNFSCPLHSGSPNVLTTLFLSVSSNSIMDEFDPNTTPIGIPPPGYVSNFTGAASQAWMPRVAIYTTLPVMAILVLLRIYCCHRLRRRFGLDDCK